ncbi:Metallo-dependent phosphatase-like protein, partial [Dichotomocladium elegans]
IDEEYLPGSSVNTDCHRYSVFGDSAAAGILGSPGQKCDAPVALAEKTLDYIARELREKIDFVIWTGDNARLMQEAFWPTARDPRHIPVVPTLGNNDVFPHNTMADPESESDLLSFYASVWREWIPTDQRALFRRGGYFTVQVAPRLWVISLNTMYFYHKNDAVKSCKKKKSPAYSQMVWFSNQLEKAKQSRVKVYVIGHVPPSLKHYRDSCYNSYLEIAAAYQDVLMGHFFGHLNMDHFLMLDRRSNGGLVGAAGGQQEEKEEGHMHTERDIPKYLGWLRGMYDAMDPIDPSGMGDLPVVAVQVAPSVLPVYYPSIRVYRYEIHEDDDRIQCNHAKATKKPHGTLLSYDQYVANITQWEHDLDRPWQEVPLNYNFVYNSEEEYNLPDLTASSYYDLAKRMTKDDDQGRDLWSRYVSNMFVRSLNDTSFPQPPASVH